MCVCTQFSISGPSRIPLGVSACIALRGAPPSHITELKAECTWQQQEQPPSPRPEAPHTDPPTHTGPELPAITWHQLCHSITPISASARTNKTKILSHWELASCSNDCRTAPLVTTQNKPSSSP